jgi:hypothetical protein
MAWAMDVPLETLDAASARHVLLLMANYAGEDGRGAFPSVATLARQSGLSTRSVQAQLAKLAELGMIRPGHSAIAAAWIGRADRRPNVWDLAVDRGAGDSPRGVNGVQLTAPRGAPVAPDPSVIHQEVIRPDWLSPELWQRWDAFRYRKTRTGWTADAAKLSLSTLTRLRAEGHDPEAVVLQSIENSWTGLFPVKSSTTGGSQHATGKRGGNGGSLTERTAAANRAHDEREGGRR